MIPPPYNTNRRTTTKTPIHNVDYLTTKSNVTAGILAILLGSFGAHKFYMGKSSQGILYLVFFWTFIPFIIGVIEGIQYLAEGQERFSERIGD